MEEPRLSAERLVAYAGGRLAEESARDAVCDGGWLVSVGGLKVEPTSADM